MVISPTAPSYSITPPPMLQGSSEAPAPAAAMAPSPASSPAQAEEAAAQQPEQEQRRAEAENRQVQALKARDREVRDHEMAHVAAAGPYLRGGPYYQFQRGPDGRNYAIGGRVEIDTAPIPNDPAATLEKMAVVQRAALAPAEPSGQDRQVAADAAQKANKARQELLQNPQAPPPQSQQNPQAHDERQAAAAMSQRLEERIAATGALPKKAASTFAMVV